MATAPSAFLHSSAFPLTEELSLTPQPEGGPGAPLLEDLSTDLVTTHEGSLLLAASATPYGEIAAAVRAAFAWPCSSADPATCPLWVEIRGEAQRMAQQEPLMGSFLFSTILNHHCLIDALAYYLAQLLSDQTIGAMQLHQVLAHVFKDLDPGSRIRLAMREDLLAIRSKDAACRNLCEAFLHYKGFLGLQSYRVAHALWNDGRVELARLLQARISTVFNMDIHPAARLGAGLLFDHASGVVIGETAVVGDGCSFLHNVTLGGTGKVGGDRHPKLGRNVSVGCGVSVLGNIKVGDNSKIGAGSVVLRDVPEGATVVGIPARVVVPKQLSESNLSLGGQKGSAQQQRQGTLEKGLSDVADALQSSGL